MSAETAYRQCALGVLDTRDDPRMRFDENGVCHYYHQYTAEEAARVGTPQQQKERLDRLLTELRAQGRGRRYDALIGLSGGVDSSYVALLAAEFGLRPLCVHFDNGWNSELAVKNIENIVAKLGFDLFTYVVNWEEFRDLQRAYLQASVVDIEAVTDHAIFASHYLLARKHGIRHILSGTNVATEAVLPPHWIHPKGDPVNIQAIHRAHGSVPLRTYPFMGLKVKKLYQQVYGIRSHSLLDLVPYRKAEAQRRIQAELGWRDYGGKHHESIWTRFYQGHILPVKFGIDKRKAHLSNLIYSGQMTKAEALVELAQPTYDPVRLAEDTELVLKKLGFTPGEWAEIMARPPRPHSAYEVERPVYDRWPWLRPLRPIVNLGLRLLQR